MAASILESTPFKAMGMVSRGLGKRIWKECEEICLTERKNGDICLLNLVSLTRRMQERLAPSRKEINAFMRLVLMTHALASWRPTQDIARFDESVYGELINSGFRGELPGEILSRLPAWSIWIETPWGMTCKGCEFDGFFVSFTQNDAISFVFPEPGSSEVIVGWQTAMSGSLSKETKMYDNDSGRMATKAFEPETALLFSRALSLTLYVCSHGLTEIHGEASASHGRDLFRKTKGGFRIFPASGPTIRRLGAELGERIRRASARRKNAGERVSMRPHVRRGHWHGYWTGKRDGKRQLSVKWLLPMLVASANAEEENALPSFPAP